MNNNSILRFITSLLYACMLSQASNVLAQVAVGTIKQISVGTNNSIPAGTSGSPAIAINGQQLVFNSNASNLVSADTNIVKDVFATDLAAGITSRVSVNTSGVQGDNDSANPAISPIAPDGFYAIAFESDASNLSSIFDQIRNRDIFIRIPTLALTEMVSLAPGSVLANGNSRSASITTLTSPNRVLIAFESDASNLVAVDTNGKTDIFLATLTIPQTSSASELLSSLKITRISAALQPDGDSQKPKISADGAFVVFDSLATNLVAGITTSGRQVFRYNVATGEISLVSKDANALPGNGSSYGASVSYTGRYISYITEAASIVSGAETNKAAVVVFDTLNSTTTRVNSNSEGIGGDGSASDATISANGRVVTFSDSSANLSTGDTNSFKDIFIKDLWSGQISRASLGESGNQGNGASDFAALAGSSFTSLNATLAYRSFATNFTSAGLGSGADIFSNPATLSARTLERTTLLEVPPDVSILGKKATLSFETFSGIAALSVRGQVAARANKPTIKYDVRVTKVGGKKKDNIRKIVKKNQIALKRLKPGEYSAKYRVLNVKGSKISRATAFSPIQNFTVIKP